MWNRVVSNLLGLEVDQHNSMVLVVYNYAIVDWIRYLRCNSVDSIRCMVDRTNNCILLEIVLTTFKHCVRVQTQ